jgi:CMP/dCMP kinase
VNRITIAIDGYSSCGKSTLAKHLASHLGYTYIDSGAMYRAVALHVMQNQLVQDGLLDRAGLLKVLDGLDIRFQHDPMTDHSSTYLNGRNVEGEIRSMDVSNNVTLVSPVPEVRAKLVKLQQAFGLEKGVVMDGRDIGTVVFPDAEVKLFMTARPEVRAQRRYQELKDKGVEVEFASVLENIRRRDLDDTTRKADPLVKAPDAVEIDNSDITAEEQFVRALDVVLDVLARVGQE